MKRKSEKPAFYFLLIVIFLMMAASINGKANATGSDVRYHRQSLETGGELTEFIETAILHSDDLQAGDQLGRTIAATGTTIVVGAYYEDGGEGDPLTSAGAAYVFEKDLGGPGNWGLAAKLTASDAQEQDRFGEALAISGDTIIVGASSESGGPGDPIIFAGAAYVFERNEGGANNWGEIKKLTASDAEPDDFFGNAVAIDDDTIVVGAYDENGGPGSPVTSSGAVYVFERNLGGPGIWGEADIIYADDAGSFDWFGWSVSLYGGTLAVGALAGDSAVSNSGAVYVFSQSTEGLGWTQTAKLAANDAEGSDYFGHSVSISGDVIVVGAPYETGEPGNLIDFSGSAYIFEKDFGGPGNWGQTEKLRSPNPGEMDYFGQSVDIDGGRIIAGSNGDDGEPGSMVEDAGAAFLFERGTEASGGWTQSAVFRFSDRESFEYFGTAVAISGGTIGVGVPGEDGGPGNPISAAGAAVVFQEFGMNFKILLPLVVKP